MPIFDYKCPLCGRVQEVLGRAGDPAPECGGEPSRAEPLGHPQPVAMERMLAFPGFRFTGQGQYGRGRV